MAEIVIVTAIENLEIVTDHAAAHHPGAEIAVRCGFKPVGCLVSTQASAQQTLPYWP